MAEISLILHDIRSEHNVGSIFRTADGAGASKIYLTGYTPAPTDRFGRANSMIAKVALGAEKTIPWEKREDLSALIAELKEKGIEIAAVEQAEGSVPYQDYKPRGPVALILGNEVGGITSTVLTHCDSVIEIPMRGEKESLNVSVAAGIVLYQISLY